MSLAQLKEVAAALPIDEQRELVAFLMARQTEHLEDSQGTAVEPNAVSWPDVEERAKQIFGDRKLPNLVLLEREESNI